MKEIKALLEEIRDIGKGIESELSAINKRAAKAQAMADPEKIIGGLPPAIAEMVKKISGGLQNGE